MDRRRFLMMSGAMLFFPINPGAGDAEFQTLFNGKDLSGWVAVAGSIEGWKAEGGSLVVDGSKGTGWLRTDREYKNFVLRLDFKLTPGGNSGVFLRAPDEGNPAFEGLEIQILDHFHEMYQKSGSKIRDVQYTGSVYDLIPASNQRVMKPVGEWNSYEITHDGDHIVVVLNGTTIVDTNLKDVGDRIDKHPGIGRKAGYIGLQNHDSRVEFRNVAIKELK